MNIQKKWFQKTYVYVLLSVFVLYGHMLFSQSFLNIKLNNDNTTEIQNEQQIAINPKDTLNLVAVWRDFRFGYRQVGHTATFDGGRTWIAETVFVESSYNWDSDPGITVDTAGNFFAVILSYNSTTEPNGLFVLKSSDGGLSWGLPVTVIDGVAGVFEDKELIACDRSGSPYTDNLYVAWTRFYSTQILMCRSTDGGNSFVGPVTVSDVVGGIQWPVPCVGANGEVYIAWCTNSTIEFDRSFDGGVTFGTDRTVTNIASMSRFVKSSITTFSYPAMDADITGGPYNGNIYIAFMDDGVDGYPDMFFTRSTDQGTTWSTPVRINDDPLGNNIDQFHPWLTVDRTGCISVIFYDSRLDATNVLSDVYLTQSTDAGLTWQPNVRVTTVSFDLLAGSDTGTEPFYPDKPLAGQRAGLIGEYNCLAAASKDNPIPIWTDTRNGNQDTYVGVNEDIGITETKVIPTKNILQISPNPTINKLSFTIDIKESDNVEIIIYNACGIAVKPVFSGSVPSGTKQFVVNDLSRLPAGVYFIGVKTQNSKECAKFTLTGKK